MCCEFGDVAALASRDFRAGATELGSRAEKGLGH